MLEAGTGKQIDDPTQGWLSRYARERKLRFLLPHVSKDSDILDFGAASGWASSWARRNGWRSTSLDLEPPADIVGDIHDWRSLSIEPHSFDAVMAFEVLEHGDFAEVLKDVLRPGGLILATTPVPRWDWACKVLERLRVLQTRTGPHTHLQDLRRYPGFEVVEWRTVGVISQWAVLRSAG